MKRCIAAMVLVLSVAVAGQLSVTVAADANIHLPGHGVAGDLATAARENDAETKRPWKCCYSTWCTRSIPPACRCMDAVEQCDEACSRCCEAAPSDPSKHICIDRYRGSPGPSCTKLDGNGEKARPWKRCDQSLYTRSAPPPPRSRVD